MCYFIVFFFSVSIPLFPYRINVLNFFKELKMIRNDFRGNVMHQGDITPSLSPLPPIRHFLLPVSAISRLFPPWSVLKKELLVLMAQKNRENLTLSWSMSLRFCSKKTEWFTSWLHRFSHVTVNPSFNSYCRSMMALRNSVFYVYKHVAAKFRCLRVIGVFVLLCVISFDHSVLHLQLHSTCAMKLLSLQI